MINGLYDQELRWLRESGRAFAAAHPQTAAALAAPGTDPDVDRLLEGTAFLCARIRQRGEEAQAELVQALLTVLAPHLVRPWPAMTILRFANAPGLRLATPIAAGTLVESGGSEPCRFRTAWEAVPPWVEVAAIALEAGEPPRLELRLSGAAPPGQDAPSRLRLHCHGEPALARALRHALLGAARVSAVLPGGALVPLRTEAVGLDPAEALLPVGGPGQGHLLLAQLAAFPDAFHFVDLCGPPGLGLRPGAGDLRVVVELTTAPGALAGVAPGNLLAGCVPAVNLWRAPADPLRIDGTAREHRLSVAGAPSALPWAVVAVSGLPRSGARRSWPGLLDQGPGPRWQELRRPSAGGDGSDLWLLHGLPDDLACDEVLSPDLLVHDGARAAALGAGDIRVPGGSVPGGVVFANLDRPSPPHEPVLQPGAARLLAQRLRLAAGGLRTLEDLRSLLELDDPRDPALATIAGERSRRGGALLSWTQRAAAEPQAGAPVRTLRHELELDEDALGGLGAAHLLAMVLERALARLAPLNTATALGVRCRRSGRALVFPARIASA